MSALPLTFRRKPVWYFQDGHDLDGDELLHVRLWDVFEARWRWEWAWEHIPVAVRASLSAAEREQIQRCLGKNRN